MKLRKKIYATFILMIVAGALSFKNFNEMLINLPPVFGIEPYLVLVGLIYLALSVGIMEYFVLFRIDQFHKEIDSIKDEGFACKRSIYNFTSKDELGGIIENVNTVLCKLNAQSQKLTTKNKLYLSLVNDESIYVCRFRVDGTVTFANKTFASSLDNSYTDMLGKNIYEYFDTFGFSSDEFKRSIALLNPSCTSSDMIYDMPRILNEDIPRWAVWKISAAFDEIGLVKEYQMVGINMHKISYFRNDKALENHQSTILLNTEGKIDYMFSHFDFSDVIGDDFLDYVHESDRWIFNKAISKLLSVRQKSVLNIKLKFSDSFVHVQMSVDCSVGKDEKIRNVVINAIDMTEIQGAQEKVVGAVSNMNKILGNQNYEF